MSAAPKAIPVAALDAPRRRINPWAIAFTVTMATFMEALDSSVANVALPHIAGGLSASVDESTWVLTSYLVANGIVLPMSAWAVGLMGRKRFYMTCVALFTLSSFMCGFAPSLPILILARILQGAGGGGLQPSEQAILADTFPPEQLGMAFAIYGMAAVLAPSIGPTLGGYITDNFNWRWIFFINIPVGVLSLILTSRLVEDPPHMQEQVALRRRSGAMLNIDYIGLSLIALSIGSLQVVLDKGQEDDWFKSHFITTFAVIALVAGIALLVWEHRTKDPVIDLHLFRDRSFAACSAMMFMVGMSFYAVTALMPLFTQTLLGYTAELSGLVLSPGGLTLMILMPIVGRLTSMVQARWLIAFGFVTTAFALYQMTNLNLGVDLKTLVIYNILARFGTPFLFIPINTLAYLDVPAEKNNQISSMVNLFRNLGGSVGVSVVSTLLNRRAQVHQDTLTMHVTRFDLAFRSRLAGLGRSLMHSGYSHADGMHQARARIYESVQKQAAMGAYLDTIMVLVVMTLLMLPFVLALKKNEPRHGAVAVH